MEDELLTPKEAAKIAKVSSKTINDWAVKHKHRKVLGAIRISARVIRFRKSNVLAFLEKCKAVF